MTVGVVISLQTETSSEWPGPTIGYCGSGDGSGRLQGAGVFAGACPAEFLFSAASAAIAKISGLFRAATISGDSASIAWNFWNFASITGSKSDMVAGRCCTVVDPFVCGFVLIAPRSRVVSLDLTVLSLVGTVFVA